MQRTQGGEEPGRETSSGAMEPIAEVGNFGERNGSSPATSGFAMGINRRMSNSANSITKNLSSGSMATIPFVNSLGSMPRIGSHGSIPSFNSHGSIARIGSQGSIPTPLSPATGVTGQSWDEDKSVLSYFLGSDGVSPLSQPASLHPMQISQDHAHQQHQQQLRMHHQSALADKAESLPPTTPAIQFYSSSKSSSSTKKSYSSFESSAPYTASAASSTVLRPSMGVASTQNGNSRSSSDQGLPGQMLPPPPRLPVSGMHQSTSTFPHQMPVSSFRYENPSTLQENHQQQQQQQQKEPQPQHLQLSGPQNGHPPDDEKQNHVDWLRQMNARAMKARQHEALSAQGVSIMKEPPEGTTSSQPSPQGNSGLQQQQSLGLKKSPSLTGSSGKALNGIESVTTTSGSPALSAQNTGITNGTGMAANAAHNGSMHSDNTVGLQPVKPNTPAAPMHLGRSTHVRIAPMPGGGPSGSISTPTVLQPMGAPTIAAKTLLQAGPGMVNTQSGITMSQTSGHPAIAPSGGNAPRQISTSSLGTSSTPQDNDERRARRLARNREAARQSRRRKKENLKFLGDKVNKLHNDIEEERRRQINGMESALGEIYKRRIRDFHDVVVSGGGSSPGTSCMVTDDRERLLQAQLENVIRSGAPDLEVRRGVASYQYSTAFQLVVPKHRRYLLWLALQRNEFYSTARESRSKASGRMTSKQIGEEITNSAARSGNHSPTGGATSSSGKNLTCNAGDFERFWPLFCYEMSLSADQEERFRAAHAQYSKVSDKEPAKDRYQLFTAASAMNSLKNGANQLCNQISNRRKVSLLEVLTPEQSSRYLTWLNQNKERCVSLPGVKASSAGGVNGSGNLASGMSLHDIATQLEQSMKLAEQLR